MKTDCHMHMILDGCDWKNAIARHAACPDREWIHSILRRYRDLGFTYLRDGGDRWGAGKAARELAPQYGIRYRTPLSPLCKKGHYGAFIGETYENMGEFAALVRKMKQVKKMIERQKEKYGWEFLFIGANIDAVETATRYGISKDRAVNYNADGEGTHILYESVAKAVCNVRASAPLGADWSDEINADYQKRGKKNKK